MKSPCAFLLCCLGKCGMCLVLISVLTGIIVFYNRPKIAVETGVFGAAEDEVKMVSVSVMEGDSVTLNPDLNQTKEVNLIQWRVGDDGSTIAQMIGNDTSYPPDERFRDRLELNNHTGSLRIRNLRTEDSGLYSVKICCSKQTSYRIFSVTVNDSGLSPGAVAGICLFLTLFFTPIMVFYYGFIICGLKLTPHEIKTIWAKSSEDVTLHTDADIQAEHQILWSFGGSNRIAKFGGVRKTYDDADGDTLMLDETGSLTIRKIKPEHCGTWNLELKIRRRRGRWWTFYKRFDVLLDDRTIPVMEGDDLTLEAEAELNKITQIKWLFGDPFPMTSLAEINGETGEIFTYDNKAEGRFKNRLKLNHLTGSLTIMNMGPEHCGCYKRQIHSNTGIIHSPMTMVYVCERIVSVEEGKNVTLEIEAEIQKDDQILWMFGAEETLIAQIKGDTRETRDVSDGRFRDRLKLEDSGSLSIRNITAEHVGAYKAQIISRGKTSYKKFNVILGNQLDESSTVVVSMLNEEALDQVNEKEGAGSL